MPKRFRGNVGAAPPDFLRPLAVPLLPVDTPIRHLLIVTQPQSLKRQSCKHVLQPIAFIRHCRALDMSLADVTLLLNSLETRDPEELVKVDVLVASQLGKVRARLQSMRALEAQLVALQKRCDADHDHHACGILEELVSAAHGEACACHPDPQGQAGHAVPPSRIRAG